MGTRSGAPVRDRKTGRTGAGIACLVSGTICLLGEFFWVSAEREEHFGLVPAAARSLVFLLGLTGLVLMYVAYRLLRSR